MTAPGYEEAKQVEDDEHEGEVPCRARRGVVPLGYRSIERDGGFLIIDFDYLRASPSAPP